METSVLIEDLFTSSIKEVDGKEEENKQSDESIIQEKMEMFKEKTKKNFEEFYKKYVPKLAYHNNKILKNYALAEDIAIISMFKALDKIKDYNPSGANISSWVFTISKNECLYNIKKEKPKLSLDMPYTPDGVTIKDFIDDGSTDENHDNEMTEMINKKTDLIKEEISNMSEPYKTALGLRELENLSYRSITIELKEKEEHIIDHSYFNDDYILEFHNPELKIKNGLPKFFSIEKIIDSSGNEVSFTILERDKDNLIETILLKSGNYTIFGEVPFNISTIKSRIRNGRKLLKKNLEEKFKQIENYYL